MKACVLVTTAVFFIAAPLFPLGFTLSPLVEMPNLFSGQDQLMGKYGFDTRLSDFSLGGLRIGSVALTYSCSLLGLSLPRSVKAFDREEGVFHQADAGIAMPLADALSASLGAFMVLGSLQGNNVQELNCGLGWYPADSTSFPTGGFHLSAKGRIGRAWDAMYGIVEGRASFFTTPFSNDLVLCATLCGASDIGSRPPLLRGLLLGATPGYGIYDPMAVAPPNTPTPVDATATAILCLRAPLITLWNDIDVRGEGPTGLLSGRTIATLVYIGADVYCNIAWDRQELIPGLATWGVGSSLYLVTRSGAAMSFLTGVSVFVNLNSLALIFSTGTKPWY